MTIRVAVVDDQELVRAGLRMVLEEAPGIEVVGEAADGDQVIALVNRCAPDVVLMDVRMPTVDGVEATRAVVAHDRSVRVLILTTFDLDEYAFAALRAGAAGFLLKDVRAAELASAVVAVARGDAVVSPRITRALLDTYMARPGFEDDPAAVDPSAVDPAAVDPAAVDPCAVDPAAKEAASKDAVPEPESASSTVVGGAGSAGDDGLTEREWQVVATIARGLSNLEIAAELFISETTVKSHVANILAKLGLRNRIHIVIYAYEKGLVPRAR